MRSFHQFLLEMDGQAVPTTGDVTNVMQKFVQIASADHAKLDFNGNDLLQVGKAFQLKVIYLTAQQIMRMAQSVASAPKSGWGGDEEEYDFDHPTGISQMKPLPGLTAIINNLSMNPTLARKFQKALAGFKQHVDYYLKINKDPSQLNQQQVTGDGGAKSRPEHARLDNHQDRTADRRRMKRRGKMPRLFVWLLGNYSPPTHS